MPHVEATLERLPEVAEGALVVAPSDHRDAARMAGVADPRAQRERRVAGVVRDEEQRRCNALDEPCDVHAFETGGDHEDRIGERVGEQGREEERPASEPIQSDADQRAHDDQ